MNNLTYNLGLPYIMPAQAQKHVTHNEALCALDAIVQLSVISRSLSAPPENASDGERFIVGSSASGAWDGKEDHIAVYDMDGWVFLSPQPGWRVWDIETRVLLIWTEQSWRAVAGDHSSSLTHGINADADVQNRLSLASEASLFNHDGHGHQLKINKKDGSETGSILFQSNYSGRGEIVSGSNDALELKVSADGQNFVSAVHISNSSGETHIPYLKYPGYWRWYNSATLIVTDTAAGSGTLCILDAASHNPSAAYDTQTGEFTAPSAGLYMLGVNFNTQGAQPFNCDIRVNNNTAARIQFSPDGFSHLSKTVLLTLSASDIVTLHAVEFASVRFDGGGLYDNITMLRLGVT